MAERLKVQVSFDSSTRGRINLNLEIVIEGGPLGEISNLQAAVSRPGRQRRVSTPSPRAQRETGTRLDIKRRVPWVGQRAGGIHNRFRREKGDRLLPERAADLKAIMRKESPRLKAQMRRNRGSVFTKGYEIPFKHGGAPVLYGKLRQSAYVRVEGTGLRWGWTAPYASRLNTGYTLSSTKKFVLPWGEWVTLPAGHEVKGRRFSENNYQRWHNGFRRRLQAHIRTGRPWSEY